MVYPGRGQWPSRGTARAVRYLPGKEYCYLRTQGYVYTYSHPSPSLPLRVAPLRGHPSHGLIARTGGDRPTGSPRGPTGTGRHRYGYSWNVTISPWTRITPVPPLVRASRGAYTPWY